MKKIASLVRSLEAGWKGDARLYRLNPPMEDETWEGDKRHFEYVIVSGVNAFGQGEETYIFPAREDGEPISYIELDGSFQGAIDHERALKNAGYQVGPWLRLV